MEDKYIGKVINNYKIISLSDKKSNDGHKLYNAECIICGHIKNDCRVESLKRYSNTNCRHYSKSGIWSSSRLREIYNQMGRRCYTQYNKDFRFYGGKGIHICDEWLYDKRAFNDWALNNGYADNLTIDRIDSNKDYSPDNCRWVTAKYNSKWKSTTNNIIVNNITDSGRGWSQRLGLSVNSINRYLRNNGYKKCVEHIKLLLKP